MTHAGRLAGMVAIVTAAGQGLGEEIAKTFAQEGSHVVIVDVNLAEAQRVADDIEKAGGSALVQQIDVTRSADVSSMVTAVVSRFGTIDILVNAAGGFTKFAPITEISDDDWDRVIALNLRSAFLCTREVVKVMIRNRRGRIVNIASGAGVGPRSHAPSYIPYGAAKAGLIGLGKLLARDVGEYNITVNTVTPGTTLTPRVRKVRDAASIEKIKMQNPMRCLVEPEDTAQAALFLVSGAARYITGVNLNVSAGNLIV